MTAQRQHILLISYHFPPSAAVGGQRAANFAKHLSCCGWRTSVLTIRDEDIEQVDRGRLSTVDGIEVHKARVQPTFVALAPRLKRRLQRSFGRARSADVRVPAAAAEPAAGPSRETFASRMKRYVMSILALPDYERGWILPASAAAIRLIRRERTDWFLTSCPPYSGHLIGLLVKRVTGRKWAADFRDPWMTTGSKRLFPTSAVSIAIESWLERKVIERCDLAVFNVERLKNAYRDRYSNVPQEKFVFLPNGITRQDTPAAVTKYERFTLSYTGSLYVGRSPEPIFEAVSRLINGGRIDADAIRIKLVGQCQRINGTPTSTVIRTHGLQSVVEVLEPVSYADSLEIVRRSHLALLFAPNLPFQVPAKVYDYLGAGTRILAIAEDGGTADLVQDTGSGRAFEPADVDGIARFIDDEFTRRSMPDDRPAAIARFEMRRIAEALSGHLERIGSSDAAGMRQWAG